MTKTGEKDFMLHVLECTEKVKATLSRVEHATSWNTLLDVTNEYHLAVPMVERYKVAHFVTDEEGTYAVPTMRPNYFRNYRVALMRELSLMVEATEQVFVANK